MATLIHFSLKGGAVDISSEQEKVIWSFGGGKGGSGRTLLATNLAILLARDGKDVILFDGNLGCANAHTALGMKHPSKTLSDFLQGRVADLSDVIVPTPFNNLRLIPGAKDAINAANPNSAVKTKLVKRLRSIPCEHLFLDIGPGTNFQAADFFLEGHIQVMLITPEPTAVETAYRFIRASIHRKLKNIVDRPLFEEYLDEGFGDMGEGNLIARLESILEKIEKTDSQVAEKVAKALYEMEFKLVVNQARDRHDRYLGPSICEIVNKFYGIHMDYAGIIPFDERVPHSFRRNTPFLVEYGKSETAAHFSLILKELLKLAPERAKSNQLNLISS
ncbi:MAG: AAA family ATPase [Nitrospinae bacterium]|nr:AAA family ATPase [Nitrospinota bacterium]